MTVQLVCHCVGQIIIDIDDVIERQLQTGLGVVVSTVHPAEILDPAVV